MSSSFLFNVALLFHNMAAVCMENDGTRFDDDGGKPRRPSRI